MDASTPVADGEELQPGEPIIPACPRSPGAAAHAIEIHAPSARPGAQPDPQDIAHSHLL